MSNASPHVHAAIARPTVSTAKQMTARRRYEVNGVHDVVRVVGTEVLKVVGERGVHRHPAATMPTARKTAAETMCDPRPGTMASASNEATTAPAASSAAARLRTSDT
jgi:hypothetical protein